MRPIEAGASGSRPSSEPGLEEEAGGGVKVWRGEEQWARMGKELGGLSRPQVGRAAFGLPGDLGLALRKSLLVCMRIKSAFLWVGVHRTVC